jgi:putative hydrolase of HD superfamily
MEDLVRLLFEVGHLKRVARSGWWLAGIKDPESVAEHSFRCALIGYFLAQRAGADAAKVATMCLMHDLQEARINDQHKVAQAYIDHGAAETKVFLDQVRGLPEEEALKALHTEYRAMQTMEALLARDADKLECAFQAREYMAAGHAACRAWFDNTLKALRTDHGRALFASLADADPADWVRALPRVR